MAETRSNRKPASRATPRRTVADVVNVEDLQELLHWAGQHAFLAFIPFPVSVKSVTLSFAAPGGAPR